MVKQIVRYPDNQGNSSLRSEIDIGKKKSSRRTIQIE